MVKQPSLLNPPSTSIPLRTLTTIPTNGSNSCCISWNPCFFCTPSELKKIKIGKRVNDTGAVLNDVYANRICSVLYSTGRYEANIENVSSSSWLAPVCAIPENLPEVGVSKARLVSAKIKISFRGPILMQGGTIMAAATFQGAPGVVAATDEGDVLKDAEGNQLTWAKIFTPVLGPEINVDDVSPFNEKIISNGIWSKNVSITKDANGISAVFVPMDSMDEIFYKPGTYFGESVEGDIPLKQNAGTLLLNDNKGARLSYIFNIQGLPINNPNPIVVETYTTWEVLPTSQSASTLRNTAQLANDFNAEEIRSFVKEYFVNDNGIHTVSGDYKAGFFGKLKKLAKKKAPKIWKSVKNYGDKYLESRI